MGCGPICALDADRNLLALGDGDLSSSIMYKGQSAEMFAPAEVEYD